MEVCLEVCLEVCKKGGGEMAGGGQNETLNDSVAHLVVSYCRK